MLRFGMRARATVAAAHRNLFYISMTRKRGKGSRHCSLVIAQVVNSPGFRPTQMPESALSDSATRACFCIAHMKNTTRPKTPAANQIESRIIFVRRHKVMLDADLADLYGVRTKVLIQAVKRNLERFPKDFMFQLAEQELGILRSQIVTSSSMSLRDWGGRCTLPYAFSEQGGDAVFGPAKQPRSCSEHCDHARA